MIQLHILGSCKLNADTNQLYIQENPSEVLEICFNVSEKFLDIPRMLEVSDLVDIEKPDEQSIMAYISAHYHERKSRIIHLQ